MFFGNQAGFYLIFGIPTGFYLIFGNQTGFYFILGPLNNFCVGVHMLVFISFGTLKQLLCGGTYVSLPFLFFKFEVYFCSNTHNNNVN
jgi:hypothetical protein